MKNNLLHMHGEFEKRPIEWKPRYFGGRSSFDPRQEIEEYEAGKAMARAFERERSRKRHMLVVVFGVLAFTLGVLALWVGWR